VQSQAAALKTELSSRGRNTDLALVDATVADAGRYRNGSARETARILQSVVGARDWKMP
jgi:hypothetical protein